MRISVYIKLNIFSLSVSHLHQLSVCLSRRIHRMLVKKNYLFEAQRHGLLRILAFLSGRLLFGNAFVYHRPLFGCCTRAIPPRLPISALHVEAPLRVGCRWARIRSSELNDRRYNPPESISRERLRNRNEYLRENETRTRRERKCEGEKETADLERIKNERNDKFITVWGRKE